MAITLDRHGSRVYLTGDTYPVKDRIKAMGGHWDGDRRAWWVGAAKAEVAAKLVASLAGEAAAAAGLSPDTPPEIVADKTAEDNLPKPKQDPNDIRLTGKGEYKGRPYYLGSSTRDGNRVRCLTMPDANGDFLDFWADSGMVKIVKTYQPREVWDGRRYSGRTVTQYTTLGGIAKFIARQKRNKGLGNELVQCPECGSWCNADESCRDCGGC